MWVLLAINVLFLVWLVSALRSSSSCEGMTGDQLSACRTGEGIVFFVILLLWALVDVILGVLYLVTRRNN